MEDNLKTNLLKRLAKWHHCKIQFSRRTYAKDSQNAYVFKPDLSRKAKACKNCCPEEISICKQRYHDKLHRFEFPKSYSSLLDFYMAISQDKDTPGSDYLIHCHNERGYIGRCYSCFLDNVIKASSLEELALKLAARGF